MSVEHMPAEVQLRNDCENLWQELNSVSLARTRQWCCVSYLCVLHMTVLHFHSDLLKLDFIEVTNYVYYITFFVNYCKLDILKCSKIKLFKA